MTTQSTNQFELLTQRRFAPFFWTQFLGAGNDNIFKFAFTVLATFHAADWGGLDAKLAGPVIGGLFILPFTGCSIDRVFAIRTGASPSA